MIVRFIRTQHPKASIEFRPELIQSMLASGWIGQPKFNGFKVQSHVVGRSVHSFSRTGKIVVLSKDINSAILDCYSDGFSFEGEHRPQANKLCVFDCVKTPEDGVLKNLAYVDRHSRLGVTMIPFLLVAPVLTEMDRLEYWYNHPETEGLVFKSGTPGFSDTSIIRCRRPEMKNMSISNRLRGK
jgi:hypothetical protein